MMNYEQVMEQFGRWKATTEDLEGMKKFGINTENNYGVHIPKLRGIAKRIGTNHAMAQKLWNSGIHDARILASMVEDPALFTESMFDKWVSEFDSWDVCDQCCGNLFIRTPFAYKKAIEYSSYEKEFVKRTGFVLMAELAVHADKMSDDKFASFFPLIKNGSTDDRNFVKKAVNWALRQIGKRNKELNKQAINTAEEIGKMDAQSAKWIARDALRELKSDKIQARVAIL